MTKVIELRIGDEETSLRDTSSDWSLKLPIGTQQVGRDHIRRSPPTEQQVEGAIAAIEEAILKSGWDASSMAVEVHSSAGELRDILQALTLGRKLPFWLTLDDVEALYRRLINVVHGRPAAWEGVPEDAAFVSRLLILREFMHHTGTERLCVMA